MDVKPTHARISFKGGFTSFQQWYYNSEGERVYLRNGTSPGDFGDYWNLLHQWREDGLNVKIVSPPDDIPF